MIIADIADETARKRRPLCGLKDWMCATFTSTSRAHRSLGRSDCEAESTSGPPRARQQCGHFPSAPLLECSEAEWREVMDVNQTGPFFGIQRAVPAMRRAGGDRSSTSFGRRQSRDEIAVAYTVEQGGAPDVTRAAAVALAPEIRVNAVTPGIIDTEMMRLLDPDRSKRASPLTHGSGRKGRGSVAGGAFLASGRIILHHGRGPASRWGALAGVRQIDNEAHRGAAKLSRGRRNLGHDSRKMSLREKARSRLIESSAMAARAPPRRRLPGWPRLRARASSTLSRDGDEKFSRKCGRRSLDRLSAKGAR